METRAPGSLPLTHSIAFASEFEFILFRFRTGDPRVLGGLEHGFVSRLLLRLLSPSLLTPSTFASRFGTSGRVKWGRCGTSAPVSIREMWHRRDTACATSTIIGPENVLTYRISL